MERHKDHRQRIYLFYPWPWKTSGDKILVWHLVDGKLRGECVTALSVRFWEGIMLFTHTHTVSLLWWAALKFPFRRSIISWATTLPTTWSITSDWQRVDFLCCTPVAFSWKVLRRYGTSTHQQSFFFACRSVLDIEPFLYGCVFVYMLMSAFLTPTW